MASVVDPPPSLEYMFLTWAIFWSRQGLSDLTCSARGHVSYWAAKGAEVDSGIELRPPCCWEKDGGSTVEHIVHLPAENDEPNEATIKKASLARPRRINYFSDILVCCTPGNNKMSDKGMKIMRSAGYRRTGMP